MKALIVAAGLALTLIDSSALAQSAVSDFAPIQFVVGSCWSGAFADGATTDEHCFEWMYGNRFIRDRHAVRDKSGAIVYQGETVYGWNPQTKRIEYRYWSAEGLMLDGWVEQRGDAILFPSSYPAADGRHELRATWTRLGNDAYKAVNAEKSGNEWKEQFSVEYRKKR